MGQCLIVLCELFVIVFYKWVWIIVFRVLMCVGFVFNVGIYVNDLLLVCRNILWFLLLIFFRVFRQLVEKLGYIICIECMFFCFYFFRVLLVQGLSYFWGLKWDWKVIIYCLVCKFSCFVINVVEWWQCFLQWLFLF